MRIARRAGAPRRRRCRLVEHALQQRVVIGPQRIEVDGDRSIGRDDVAHAGDCGRAESPSAQRDRARVDRRVDPLLELDEQRRVAGRHDRGRAFMRHRCSARSSFWWMPPKPPFDISTTRSPCAVLAHDRVDDVVERRRPRAPTGRVAADRARARGTDSRSASGSVERNTGAISTSSAAANARAKSSWNTRRHDDAERGSNTAQIRASGCDAAQAGERFGDRRRMVREVVVDRHAVGDADDFEPPLDARERRAGPRRSRSTLDADLGRHRNRRQRIAHVVRAEQRHLERRRTARRRGAR